MTHTPTLSVYSQCYQSPLAVGALCDKVLFSAQSASSSSRRRVRVSECGPITDAEVLVCGKVPMLLSVRCARRGGVSSVGSVGLSGVR